MNPSARARKRPRLSTPDAVAAMLEVGIDISGQQPKRVDPFMRERVSYLVTLCERDGERTLPNFSVRVPGAEMAD